MLINIFVSNFILLFLSASIFNLLTFYFKLNYIFFVFVYLILFIVLFKQILQLISYKAFNYFSLIISLPFLIIILMRFSLVYPMYDDMSYHLSASFVALKIFDKNHFLPISGLETYPLFFQYIYGLLFRFFGYRLGLLFLGVVYFFWITSLINRFILRYKDKKIYWLLGVFVLYGFMQNYVISTAGTFMTDIPLILLCLECFWQLYFVRSKKNFNFAVFLYFLTLLSKPSTGFFTLPIFLTVILFNIRKINKTVIFLSVFYFLLFLLGHYYATGTPFPGGYFSNYFNSPYFNKSGFSVPKDNRFGPVNFEDKLFWPVKGYFASLRFAEVDPVKSAKYFYYFYFVFGFLGSLFLIVYKKFRVSPVVYAVLFSYYFWSFLNGYARYASAFVLLSATLVCWNLVDVFGKLSFIKKFSESKNFYVLILSLSFISLVSYRTDYAWRNYPSLKDMDSTRMYFNDLSFGFRHLFKDKPNNISKILYNQVSNFNFKYIVPYYRGNSTFYAAMLSVAGENKHIAYIYSDKYYQAKKFLNIREDDPVLFLITEDYVDTVGKSSCTKNLSLFDPVVIKHRIEKVLWAICKYKDLESIYSRN